MNNRAQPGDFPRRDEVAALAGAITDNATD